MRRLAAFLFVGAARDAIIRAPRAGRTSRAKVAELVDALDLGSSGVTRESSSLSFRTSWLHLIDAAKRPDIHKSGAQ